jgi:hypothetical protein
MSVATTQAAIAAAAGTVAGVRGHEKKPDSPGEGDAWPTWYQTDVVLPGAFDVTWRLNVVLPFDAGTAIDRAHVLIDEITIAVQTQVPGAAVGRVRTAKLADIPNSPPALIFDVRAAATYGE